MLFASLRGYRAVWIPNDLLAGVLLAAIAIPEQFATARLAGMPPETGLLAFAAGTVAFAVFGASKYLSVGADSTTATIFAVTVAAVAGRGTAEYALTLGAIAIVVGVVLLAVGLARAEWISDLISIPVAVGFLAGIAVQIVISQLPALFGVTVPDGPALARLAEFVRALPHTNVAALGIGAGVLAIIVAARLASPKIPGAIVAFAGAAGAVALLHLQGRLPMVGALAPTAMHWHVPVPHAFHPRTILPLAGVIAVVCVLQTVTTLRTFRSRKGIVDVGPDIAATGIGSIVAGFAGAFPVNASPPRTAILKSSNAQSQLAGLVAVGLIALFVVAGSRVTADVPDSALAAILLFIAWELFQFREMARIGEESRLEIALVIMSALLVIVLPINDGMILSILLSLFYGVYVMLRPPCVELVHVPGTTIWWPPSGGTAEEHRPGVVVFSPAAPLYFMNARYVVARLFEAVERAPVPVQAVVIDGSGVSDIDYTAAHVVKSAVETLRARGIAVAIARLSEARAMTEAQRTGIVGAVGADRIFKSADEAVNALAPARP